MKRDDRVDRPRDRDRRRPDHPSGDAPEAHERAVAGHDVAPGAHTVAISYPWLVRECGRATVTITLQPGETKRVSYRARMTRFVPGAIAVDEAVPTAPALRD